MSMNGVKFNDIHSYYDLNLILSQCSISPAKPKTNYIDIPGADGSLDLTEALGGVRYNDRTGTLVFSVLPDAGDFEEKKSEISNLLNGKYIDRITLDKDPDYYYQGRCSINEWKCNKTIGQITVDLKLKPWKLKQEKTVVSWWGNIGNFALINDAMPVVPTFEFTGSASVDFNGSHYELSAGTYRMPEICLLEGENIITIETTDYTTITYQEGRL